LNAVFLISRLETEMGARRGFSMRGGQEGGCKGKENFQGPGVPADVGGARKKKTLFVPPKGKRKSGGKRRGGEKFVAVID